MGDIFFPFLPGSGTAVPHERYYEALQAAAVSRYYKEPATKKTSTNNHHYHHYNNHGKSIQSDGESMTIQPGTVPQPPVAPPTNRSHSRLMSSPPVPAVLKKIRISTNGDSPSSSEKHEWENYTSTDHDTKIDKDFENLQIKEKRPCSEQDKQDILFRLSILKQVI